MTVKIIDLKLATEAFKKLDLLLKKPIKLILGGGTAMIMAHNFPLSTSDIDAVAKNCSLLEIEKEIKQVATELNLSPDWLNPHFSSFLFTLPDDFENRLIRVFDENYLSVFALGKEDMLLMKCFAHRAKDKGHAQFLLKNKLDLSIVENQIELLKQKKIPGSDAALDFLDLLLDESENE